MRQSLLMPKLGLTMTEGIVAEWSVQVGKPFKAGQCLYVVETDKVATEIEAPADGVLLETQVAVGQTAAVGTVLAYWEPSTNSQSKGAPLNLVPDSIPPPASEPNAQPAIDHEAMTPQAMIPASSSPSLQPEGSSRSGERIIASPYARKRAREVGVPLTSVAGTGPGGRIVARDIDAAIKRAVPSAPSAVPSAPSALVGSGNLIEPSNRQKLIAQRLTQSKQEIPHFYLFRDIDVTELLHFRKKLNSGETESRISMTHLITRAVALALGKHPEANRIWTQDGIRTFDQIDIGIAVDTDRGLVAPALMDIGSVPLLGLVERVETLISNARSGRLSSTPTANPVITISNAGMHNVTYMASIITPGESMILGVGGIKPVFRPDENEQPTLRQEMGVVLSVDHRVLNGVDALKFLNTLSQFLEKPLRLLMAQTLGKRN
jgi:pyruvate dehydrogenase E2 component (dihydrolipoamide acetyltransferase)